MAIQKLQISLRIDETLYGKLKSIATDEGRTANNMIVYIVNQYVANYEAKHGPVAEYEE